MSRWGWRQLCGAEQILCWNGLPVRAASLPLEGCLMAWTLRSQSPGLLSKDCHLAPAQKVTCSMAIKMATLEHHGQLQY